MKGVILQNGNTHKERQNKERWERRERGGEKKGRSAKAPVRELQ